MSSCIWGLAFSILKGSARGSSIVPAGCSSVSGALMLPVLLLILLTALPRWWVPLVLPGLPGSQAPLPWEEQRVTGSYSHRYPHQSQGCQIPACHCYRNGRRLTDASVTWGVRTLCHCCSVPCGCGCHYNLEAWITWATSTAATRVSGAVASAAATVRLGLQAPSPLSPQFFLFCVF